MSRNNEEERSIPNPLHYFGQFCMAGDGPMVIVLSLITAVSGAINVGMSNDRDANAERDNQGTAMEESAMSHHREAFNEIKATKTALDEIVAKNAIHTELGVLSDEQKEETRRLATIFSEQVNSATLDLYLKDVNPTDTADEKAGAAISENNFRDFHIELEELTDGYESIQENIGMNTTIYTPSLDECIASSDLTQSDEYSERYKDMQEINSCMASEFNQYSNDNDNSTLAILTFFGGLLGGIGLFGFGGEKMSKLPERIKLKPKRKTHKW